MIKYQFTSQCFYMKAKMANFKNIAVLIVVYALLAACLGQISQGKPHESQGGAQESQGGGYESQGGGHESQGGSHESQGGAQESQGGTYESQEGAQESQGGTYESQEGSHEPQVGSQESQGGAHDSQVGPQESQGGAGVSQEGPHKSQGGSHVLQGGAHEEQRRVRRQAAQGPGNQGLVEWTTCDFTAASKISCQDCNTRVICKPIGGILKPCGPQRPFCNNGLCSIAPSTECA